MNLLFWNLKKNNSAAYVADLLEEQHTDLAIFSEYSNTDWNYIYKKFPNTYTLHDGLGGCEKVTLLCKKEISIVICREHTRYTIYACSYNNEKYLIAGVHLPSNPHSTDEDRKHIIRELITDLSEQENNYKGYIAIVIGDFNASPFDSELTQKNMFNAVLYKKLIEKAEYIKYGDHKYRRFYNPMIIVLTESTQTYGSLYYSSGIASLYWFCYDQILVRKPLVDKIEDLQIRKKIKNKSLLKEVQPDPSISDHLPLTVTLKG